MRNFRLLVIVMAVALSCGAAQAAPDLAYGAYQRGLYNQALREATLRLEKDKTDSAAMTLLGELYNQGLGVPASPAKPTTSAIAALCAIGSPLELRHCTPRDALPRSPAPRRPVTKKKKARASPSENGETRAYEISFPATTYSPTQLPMQYHRR